MGIICQAGCFGVSMPVQAYRLHKHSNRQPRISNVEQGLPAFGGARGDQGFRMMKFKNFVPPFDIHYSLFDILLFAF
jgi:hypothetical protein